MRIVRFICGTAALLILTAFLATGCGGDSSQEGPEKAPLTKAAFIKKGDAICNRIDRDEYKGAARYVKQHPGQGEEEAQKGLVSQVALPLTEEAIGEIKELRPPKADKADVEAMISAMEKGVDRAEKDPAAALGSEGNPFTRANELAATYGFDVCKDIL